jgi:KDO2-lipid IV(A) lauroyltransferase
VKHTFPTALLWLLHAVLRPVVWGMRLFGWRRSLLQRHLVRCLPEFGDDRRRGIAAGFYRYLGELASEVFAGLPMGRDEILRRVRFANPEVVEQLLGDGRRVLVLSAHHSNWEWLLLAVSAGFSQPMVAAYKPLRNAALDARVRRWRERLGGTMVPAKQLVPHLMEQRGQVRLLAMLADQSPPAVAEQQAWLDFFGQPTAFFRGPGWICARLGYVPVFAAMQRERFGRYRVEFTPLAAPGERFEPEQVLVRYIERLEAHVRANPDQYFWAYNRWKREKPLYG